MMNSPGGTVQPSGLPTFPQWMIGIIIVSAGVWLATQWNTEAAWYLAILIVLGVLIKRDTMLVSLNEFLSTVFKATGVA